MVKKNERFTICYIITCIFCFIFLSPLAGMTSFAMPENAATESVNLNSADLADLEGKNYSNIVLFAYFQDQPDGAAYFSDTTKVSKILDMYNGSHGRSFTNYMSTISYGKFQVMNVFPQYDAEDGTINAARLTINSSDAMNGNIDSSILSQVLSSVDLEESYLDLDKDGMVDNITVILQGGSGTNVPTSVSLYPHKGNYPEQKQIAGKWLGTYNVLNTYRLLDSFLAEESGLIAHEFLHSLGYPDLYEKTDNEFPVYTWDIMAQSSSWPAWPLAYTRMYFSDWVRLDTITASKTLTLDNPDVSGGRQAYILKSPLNEHELFVVEMRTKNPTDLLSRNTLDAKISGYMSEGESGLIVYRVDTTVEGLSNHFGSTGIYVFRPQSGYTSQDLAVQAAYLSPKSGRTSIGTDDMTAGVVDGALTFTDGSNSGIQIKNVSISGEQMTCEVVIPKEDEFDLWENTGFVDAGDLNDTSRTVAMVSYQNRQYIVACRDNSFTLYCYSNGAWNPISSTWKETRMLGSEMKLVEHNQKLYLGYITSDGQLRLKSFDPADNTWSDTALYGGSSIGFDMKSLNGTLYIVCDESSSEAKLLRLNGDRLENQGTYFSGLGGQPQITGTGDDIYVSFRRAKGNIIEIYRYNGAEDYTKVSDDTISSNTYGMIALNNQLKVVSVGSQTTVYSYNGSEWSVGKSVDVECYDPKLTTAQGNLYMLTSSPTGDGYTYVYQYDSAADTWLKEGEMVDFTSRYITLTSSGDYLYISYVLSNNNTIRVRRKAIVNKQEPGAENPEDKEPEEQKPGAENPGEKEPAGQEPAGVQTPESGLSTPEVTSVKNTVKGVKITWKKVTGAVKYRIFYKVGKGNWKKLKDTTATSYTWTKAKSGKTYAFTVQCITGNNTASDYDSNGKSITFIAAPKVLSAKKVSAGIKINWRKVTGAKKYRILYKTGKGKWKKLKDTTFTSYTWTKPQSGKKYSFTVQCIAKNGKRTISAYNTTGKKITYKK